LKSRTAIANPFQTETRSAPFALDAPKLRTIETLRSLGKQSRSTIAELITYSPSKMTSVVNDLIDDGILEEVGEEASTGGRKARAIDFNPNFGYFAAATIEPTRFDVALVDFAANIRVRRIIPLPEDTSPQNILNIICDFLLERLEKLNIPLEKILGFGLATPIAVDVRTGTLWDSPYLPGWGGYQIDSHLRELFPYAVTVLERDVNAIAYGMLRRGLHPHKSFVAVKANEPRGVGIVIDGRIYQGASGCAGEIGAAKDDEAFCRDLALLIQFIDPEAVIIAGDGSEIETQFAAMLGRHLLEQPSPARQRRRLERSALGLEAMITGLILQVAENVFTLAAK
jgi:predicted NBD/HSP70 family sugar kinase